MLATVNARLALARFRKATRSVAELCEGVAGCIEAWTSDQAYFYRFDSNAAAEDFLKGVEDGFRSDRIAVDFDVTDPSPEVKRQIQELVEGAHSLT